MSKKSKLGAAGRFGVRYGQATKRRISEVELKQRKKQKCIFCTGRAIRLSKGIWKCLRCDKKFAGHAYYLEPLVKSERQQVLNKQKSKNNQINNTKAKKIK